MEDSEGEKWKTNAQDAKKWQKILEEDKVLNRLKRQIRRRRYLLRESAF